MASPRPNATHLTDRAISGDGDAFVELLKIYNDDLRALAYSVIRDAAVLDDVMQESFLKAFRSIQNLRDRAGFKAWIHRIVYTTAVDVYRHRTANIPTDVVDKVSSASVASQAASRVDINVALWQIPGGQRVAVLLVDGEGFDYQTAATILNIPPGTVASRVSAGRAALRHLLQISEKES